MAKKETKEISVHKTKLAQLTATKLIEVLEKDVPDSLRAGFVALFATMQNKTLERFNGLLSGVPME